VLAELEKQGCEVWINHAGTRIAVRGKADLSGLHVKPVDEPWGGDGWYRPAEMIRLSEEEARVLAERFADQIPDLSADVRSKLRGVLERRLLDQFRAFHSGKPRDPKERIKLDPEPVLADAKEILTPEQLEALRKCFGR
jgi:hypothetical protein